MTISRGGAHDSILHDSLNGTDNYPGRVNRLRSDHPLRTASRESVLSNTA
jgi:hypothetical protein